MRTQKTTRLVSLVTLLALVVAMFSAEVSAQTTTVQGQATTPAPAPRPAPAAERKKRTPAVYTAVVLENKSAPPQVVTILHTLSGLKVIRLLARSKEQVEAIARLDQAFKIAGEVHTNVIAGLALDDGRTIVAWLPEAEAELPPRAISFRPRAPVPPEVPGGQGVKGTPEIAVPAPHVPTVNVPAIGFHGNLLESADLRVISRDGKRMVGRYVGLDGLTGLSLITLSSESGAPSVDAAEIAAAVGDRLRVIGPQPAAPMENGAPLYIRLGETEGIVVSVSRSPSGGQARVKIKSAKFSPANIGGIAVNEKGETLGIVENVKDEVATVVPIALVRMAAKRVMERQASVPRPWLGIRGEPIGAMTLDRIQRAGWELDRARALAEKRLGILLSSVAPGSPADKAKLKRGDVILSVNDGFIRNAEEFSWLLDEATAENPVRFTVARPGNEVYESFNIKLSESPDPFFGLRTFQEYKALAFGSPLLEGVEVVALKPRPASRLGSSGGLLVVSVQPSTDAFKWGLRAGDVIEAVNGQSVFSGNALMMLPKTPGASSTYVVVRNKEKISLTFKYSTDSNEKTP